MTAFLRLNTPYYEDRSLSRLTNIPYEVTHVCPEPAAAPPELVSLTATQEPEAAGLIELESAEALKTANQEFFLWREKRERVYESQQK